MTTLAITPNWKNKTAKSKGTVAAGEHVSVTIQNDNGEGEKVVDDASTLRLRVVGMDGRTLAIFPEPVPEGETPETWGEADLTPLTCTLNLNTVQMLKAVPPAANVPLLWVLDDYDNKTLYFKEQFEVTHWPRRFGEEEPAPTNLDDYKDIIEDFNTRLTAAEQTVATAATNAQNAAISASAAASSAATAATAATDAQTGAIASKNAAQTAANDAATAKTAAEDAQDAAEAAQEAAETAQGKAQKYAEAAAESAATFVVDDTLSVEGAAADAKAVGEANQDLITQIETVQDNLDNEVAAREELDGAVQVDRQNLANEIARAQGAEQTLEANKADKATTYTKAEVDTKIAGVQTFKKYLVQTLPDPDEADMKGLYLVPTGETSEEGDLCEEWTVVEDSGEKRWEKIGGTTVDPANYYDKDAVDDLLDDKQDALTFDNAPTPGSSNHVKSGGIWSALWGTATTAFSSVYDWVVSKLSEYREKLDLAVYERRCIVSFPDGYSIIYESDTYTAPSGGESIELYGPISSTAAPQYNFWVPYEYKDTTDFDPMVQSVWCLYGGDTPYTLMYRASASYRIANWNTEAPTLTLSNGEESGGHPTMTRPVGATGDTLAKASQLAGKVPTSRTVNGKALSSDVTLTGANIPVDATQGAQKISAALAGKLGNSGDQTITSGSQAVGFGFDTMDPWIKFTDARGNSVYLYQPQASGIAATTANIPYSLGTKTISNNAVTLDDRASNAVTISTTLSPNTLTINFPTAPTGKLRDFAMRLNIAAGVTAPEIAWPKGVTLENDGGEVPEIADGGTGGSSTILYFSESENNGTTAKFLVKGETLTAITQA